ncbi:MAG: carboxypeptidase-like regulatory domain-containing protein [Bacteroidetes bacterium]|nr:carboxypeptidase-like regulatory domain-containing protein [Bacteroidota bacterium]
MAKWVRLVTLMIFIVAMPLTGNAQVVRGWVVNALTDLPVPNVLVSDTQRHLAVRTDTAGRFLYPALVDTLLFSAPGFLPFRLGLTGTDSLVVRLAESPLIIQNITFDARRPPVPVLTGALNKRFQGLYASCDSTSFHELALFIPTKEVHRAILSKIYYYVPWRGKQRASFRVRIYQHSEGRPGRDLLDESVVVNPKWWQRWKEVRVGPYNIPVPNEGFFVSMEWLNGPDSRYVDSMTMNDGSKKTNTCFGPVLGLTDEFEECHTWTRSNGGEWERFPCKASASEKALNAMIRIEWLQYR